jgi:hypothetical protein
MFSVAKCLPDIPAAVGWIPAMPKYIYREKITSEKTK